MQISTFKLSYFELESGFLMQNTLKLIILTISLKNPLNICNISCDLDFLFYTKNRKS